MRNNFYSYILKLCVTILLRNYIIDVKSETQSDAKPFEVLQSRHSKPDTFGDHVDEIAPWPNVPRSLHETEDNAKHHTSGKINNHFLSTSY